jgi:hypothetical protein
MTQEFWAEQLRQDQRLDRESLSGPGSTITQTQFLRPELEVLLGEFGVRSLIDAPCGDFNWMRVVDLSGIDYLGVDVVPALIARNRELYGAFGYRFECADVRKDPLPPADLVLIRDLFFHFPTEDIRSTIRNVRASGIRMLLTTTFTWRSVVANGPIPNGGWRRINLQLPPFDWPAPLRTIVEANQEGPGPDRCVCLWNVNDVPDA